MYLVSYRHLLVWLSTGKNKRKGKKKGISKIGFRLLNDVVFLERLKNNFVQPKTTKKKNNNKTFRRHWIHRISPYRHRVMILPETVDSKYASNHRPNVFWSSPNVGTKWICCPAEFLPECRTCISFPNCSTHANPSISWRSWVSLPNCSLPRTHHKNISKIG